jgi:hypothetical protein
MYTLHQVAVKGLSNSIVLWGVAGGKALLSILLGKELGESTASVFAAAIRSQAFEYSTMLGLGPGNIRFVCIKCFILGLERGLGFREGFRVQ